LSTLMQRVAVTNKYALANYYSK